MAAPPDRKPVQMAQLVLPSHTNALGTIFGGVVMGWMDIAGAIAAKRWARSNTVTVSVDSLHFIAPIKIGYTARIEARLTYAGRTSMEVEIKVIAENSITGEEKPATKAFFTFVAIDENGRPTKVPTLVPKTEEEKKQGEQAKARREARLKSRH